MKLNKMIQIDIQCTHWLLGLDSTKDDRGDSGEEVLPRKLPVPEIICQLKEK